MFRSIIEENTRELESISKLVKKIGKFQYGLDKNVKNLLKQKVGEVKKTLPSARIKMDDCMKRVGDADMCTIVISKYNKFYTEVCQATPAICDDYHAPMLQMQDHDRIHPVPELKKGNVLRI